MTQLTAKQVADYFLYRANDAEEPITNLKLQKLLYYAQGYYLATQDDLLFDDEIQAWAHGPVVPNVYHTYKHFRWKPISRAVSKPTIKESIVEFLDLIIETFLPKDAYKLELMTHQETPWVNARSGLPKDAFCINTISTEDMNVYFSKLMSDEQA